MKNSLAISLNILLAYSISFAATVNKEHFYGEWTSGDELTFIYNFSANSFKMDIVEYSSLGIPFKSNNPILKWEYANNQNKTLNANFPNGYLVKTTRGDGSPTYFYLWKHHKNNDIIMFQAEEFFLQGKYDILKKSIPFKQTDYYGDWHLDGVPAGMSVTTISANNIKYSGFENGEPIQFNFPILRWEPIKNPDEKSIAVFPDGYMISTESTGGYPKTLFLWRKSKSNDIILFQSLDDENSLLLVRAKRKGGSK